MLLRVSRLVIVLVGGECLIFLLLSFCFVLSVVPFNPFYTEENVMSIQLKENRILACPSRAPSPIIVYSHMKSPEKY